MILCFVVSVELVDAVPNALVVPHSTFDVAGSLVVHVMTADDDVMSVLSLSANEGADVSSASVTPEDFGVVKLYVSLTLVFPLLSVERTRKW